MVSDDLALAPRSLPGFDWRLSADARPHGVRLAATPTSTAQPQAVAGQLTAAIVTAKDRQIEIRLDPPELGRVQIQLDQTETGLRAVVMAERPETHDLLRRHAELLQRELAGAGYRNVDLGFAAGGQTDAREGEARGGRLHGAAATAALPVPPPAAAPSRSITGGLDIRL